MTRRLLVVGAVLVLGATSQAGVLTLKEAEEKALAANPKVRAAQLAALAAGERSAQVRSRRFGELDLVGSYANFESPRLIRAISIDLFTNPQAGFS